MQENLKFEYRSLLDLIKQLPASQLSQLVNDLVKELEQRKLFKKDEPEKKKSDFQKLLLQGPLMTDDQYNQFTENRKQFEFSSAQ